MQATSVYPTEAQCQAVRPPVSTRRSRESAEDRQTDT